MRSNPERLAWGVLLAAASVFCALCVSTGVFLRWFIFESSVQLEVELSVSRNTVGVSVEGRAEETERGRRLLVERATLTTDSTSQAFLIFRDSYSNRVLATLTLFHDSVITIHNTGRPRFETSASPYTVEIIGERGRGDVLIATDLGRDIRFGVLAAYDTTVDLDQSGHYTIALGGDHAGVTTHAGQAVLGLRASGLTETVSQGYSGIAPGPDPDHPIGIVPAGQDLLINSGFEFYDPPGEDLPSSWGCYNDQEELDEPHGQSTRETSDGRAVLRIRRVGEGLNHAETGCRQLFDLDLAAYSYLELRATMYMGFQDISTCGIAGSECPVMLRIVYVDGEGELREWIHGFYSLYTISEWPITCPSCRQDHERINGHTWYTYESGNLVNILPPETKMHSLVEVRFYASGHAYDVMLDEVSLIAVP
jgi:hypothetical protein